jgi:hypothetical protein
VVFVSTFNEAIGISASHHQLGSDQIKVSGQLACP